MLQLSIIPDECGLRNPLNGVNYHFSSPDLDQLYVVGKLWISEAQICSFSRISHKINKLQICRNILHENLEILPSTSVHDSTLERSTNFLPRSSTSRKPMERS